MELINFSDQFDILYNNIMSNQAPGLNEYEKSVFLTKAQDEIVKNYFNPNGNKYKEGFDGNQKRQIDFSMILNNFTGVYDSSETFDKIDSRSRLYSFPGDVMMVVNESCMETRTGETAKYYYVVIPVSYDEYTRLMSKPYKLPLKSQVWRILSGNNVKDESSETSTTTLKAELIGNFAKSSTVVYTVRYVRRPKPIILVDLDDMFSNVSIDGYTKASNCELDPMIHEEILQRAVELAKVAYAGDAQSAITIGERSE